jgi:serpin B
MMYQKGKFRYLQNDIAQVLEMPYAGGEVSMIAILPNPDMPRGIRLLDASLTDEILSGWLRDLNEEEVKVYFPRFELTWGTADISGHLAVLGILDAFGGRADFSGMSDLQDLFVGPVFHKAFVKFNEEGTEAAAATAVVMKRLAIEHETVFRADRPFLFLIRDNATGSILFMGRIADLD